MYSVCTYYLATKCVHMVMCHVRYCTDRYPKAEAYGTCNWCLRAGQGSGDGGGADPSPVISTFKVPGRPVPGGV